MKYTFVLLLVLIVTMVFSACGKTPAPALVPPATLTTHGIIPLPKSLDLPTGSVIINQDFVFVTGSPFKIATAAAQTVLENLISTFKTSDTATSGQKTLQLIQDNSIKGEAYKLLVNADGILISAGTETGAFWAVQSLKQYLISASGGIKQSSLNLPFLTVTDEPKYAWRGFHLDVSRHMFSKDYLLKLIDWLAYYKYNKFHLHLTDDQGWRIESKKFPLLNSIGSWRFLDHNDSILASGFSNPEDQIDPQFLKKVNGRTMYGGYYTQADIAEIIAYAKNHFIEIVPEIDMPGHMSAAINSYPELSCTGASGFGTEFSYPICPCNQRVFDFAYQVWDEASSLFPSNYVHIGADEVDKKTWETSIDCQDFMKSNNLSTIQDIQSYFVGKLQSHLEEKGKTVLVWDDVTDGKFDSKLKIMYWRDWVTDAPAKAAANGNDIIFTRWDLFYLSSDNTPENLQNLLEFDVTQAYPASVNNKIIGFQGCVWTEQIPSEKALEALIFPRIQALAEVNWSANKDIFSFKTRLEPHVRYMKACGVNYKF